MTKSTGLYICFASFDIWQVKQNKQDSKNYAFGYLSNDSDPSSHIRIYDAINMTVNQISFIPVWFKMNLYGKTGIEKNTRQLSPPN